MATIASQKRSSSALLSLSVGSTISVPATGKDTVGRVEAVVDEALGDIVHLDAADFLSAAEVEDALVRHPAARAAGTGPGSARPGGSAT